MAGRDLAAQAQRALRGLIRAWHSSRRQGLPAIPADARDPLAKEFRHAVRPGWPTSPASPARRTPPPSTPGRDLLEFCRDRQDDVLRFCYDTRIWPTNNISERGVRPSRPVG